MLILWDSPRIRLEVEPILWPDEPPDDIKLAVRRTALLVWLYVVEALRSQGTMLLAHVIQISSVDVLERLPDRVLRSQPEDSLLEVLPGGSAVTRLYSGPLKEFPIVPPVVVPLCWLVELAPGGHIPQPVQCLGDLQNVGGAEQEQAPFQRVSGLMSLDEFLDLVTQQLYVSV